MFLENSVHRNKQFGSIEVICGSMFSGKTEELIRRLKRAKIANQKIQIFKPSLDSRNNEYIESHDKKRIKSLTVKTSYDVFDIDDSIAIEFALLSYQDQPRVMALTILGDGNLEKNPLPRRAAICIEVDDVDDAVSKCNENGFHCYGEDHLITHDGREGKEVGILDDDGNLIVIYKIEKPDG